MHLAHSEPTDPVLVHSIPGRVRVRFRDALDEDRLVIAESLPGVNSARANAACRSIVVRYDAARVSVDAIVRWLREPDVRPGQHATPVENQANAEPLRTLAITAAGLLLTLFGAPPPVALAVVGVGAIPIAMRAAADLREGDVSADFLDATAVGILLLRGSTVAAAISTFFIAAGEYIRTLTARRSRKALDDLFASSAQFAWVLRDAGSSAFPRIPSNPGRRSWFTPAR
jgi:cation transport ATPase